jgi:hypothetical protein
MSPRDLEKGYHGAVERFYSWGNIFRSAGAKGSLAERLRHILYAGGWMKFAAGWDLVIRLGLIDATKPLLHALLSAFGQRPAPLSGRRGCPSRQADSPPLGAGAIPPVDADALREFPPEQHPRQFSLVSTSSTHFDKGDQT